MSSRRIVVGVGGGIAAYKIAGLVSRLVQRGDHVDVVLTYGATQFVGPATFSALCGRPPISDTYDSSFPFGPHIELAEGADVLVIAPATARLMASCAMGLADDLLSTLYLACGCPVLMAPAMSTRMWQQPSVQRNKQTLLSDGVQLVGPSSGWLSCRKQGIGRMAEPEEILAMIDEKLT